MGSDESSRSMPQARVLLRVDSVSACKPLIDRSGWSHLERARLAEINDPLRRAQYAVGHWRVRGLASVAFGGEPANWRWDRPPGEAARLVDDARGISCFASLSHNGDHVACAVGQELVGVDLEAIRDERGLEALAKRCLAPEEAEDIAGLEGRAQAVAFYRGWAIREALGKAAGTGLVPGTARRIRARPASPEVATVHLWTGQDQVLALAHCAGAIVEGVPGVDSAPETFTWDLD